MRKMGQETAVTRWSSSKPSLHPHFHSEVAVGAHMGSATQFQMRTRRSRDRVGKALVILWGEGEKALSIRNSVGLLIFNFIFAKNISTLVVVVKLERSCLYVFRVVTAALCRPSVIKGDRVTEL